MYFYMSNLSFILIDLIPIIIYQSVKSLKQKVNQNNCIYIFIWVYIYLCIYLQVFMYICFSQGLQLLSITFRSKSCLTSRGSIKLSTTSISLYPLVYSISIFQLSIILDNCSSAILLCTTIEKYPKIVCQAKAKKF